MQKWFLQSFEQIDTHCETFSSVAPSAPYVVFEFIVYSSFLRGGNLYAYYLGVRGTLNAYTRHHEFEWVVDPEKYITIPCVRDATECRSFDNSILQTRVQMKGVDFRLLLHYKSTQLRISRNISWYWNVLCNFQPLPKSQYKTCYTQYIKSLCLFNFI